MENAVKHNAHLKQDPLHIQISTNEDEQLLVRNNLQRQNVFVDSGKVGLKNISNKYKLLRQPDIVIIEADGHFTVCLPLMTPNMSKVTVLKLLCNILSKAGTGLMEASPDGVNRLILSLPYLCTLCQKKLRKKNVPSTSWKKS